MNIKQTIQKIQENKEVVSWKEKNPSDPQHDNEWNGQIGRNWTFTDCL